MQPQQYASGRRLGLDWLRIGAFALLIFYHIGMFFVTWDWHVKTSTPLAWLEVPMLALSPWRLALLFLISGVASRVLLAKSLRPGGFLRERSSRLLIPLLFGMAVIVAPQAWVELQEKAGYDHAYWHFWLNDYFRFDTLNGVGLPTWNHLWFVAYLWVYSAALALLAIAPERLRSDAQRSFERLFGGWRLFVVPVLWLWATRVFLYPSFPPTHAVVDDPYSHSVYGFAFFFGIGLARSQPLWQRLVTHWKMAALAALASYAIYAGFYLVYQNAAQPGAAAATLIGLARSIQTWGALLALLGVAQLHLHRDGPARRYLTEAVFPYYIAHQTIIVIAASWLKPRGLGAGMEFLLLMGITLVGCVVTYEVARRLPWLRRPFGLKPSPGSRFSATSAAPVRA